jgi:hypothetical protein
MFGVNRTYGHRHEARPADTTGSIELILVRHGMLDVLVIWKAHGHIRSVKDNVAYSDYKV